MAARIGPSTARVSTDTFTTHVMRVVVEDGMPEIANVDVVMVELILHKRSGGRPIVKKVRLNAREILALTEAFVIRDDEFADLR